jgi:enoyl-CoA hydratase/carnithine racemase
MRVPLDVIPRTVLELPTRGRLLPGDTVESVLEHVGGSFDDERIGGRNLVDATRFDVVTLRRPERLNALHGPLVDELADAVARIDGDDDIRVWLLTGAPRPDGRPCFGAGVDLRSFEEGKGVTVEQASR